MGEIVQLPGVDGTRRGYLAVPEGVRGPAVVVIQEWWGLVPHIQEVCDRFAEEGFVALAPDLYRGEVATEYSEADRMMQEMDIDQAAREMVDAIHYVLDRNESSSSTAGVVGFCSGGALALVAANAAPEAVVATVPFYGLFWFANPDLTQIRGSVLMHLGGEDQWISQSQMHELAEKVRTGGAHVDVRVYPGAGHAFFNDSRQDAHHPEAQRQAWAATLEFLRAHVT